ncbi:MAG TPA: hypothetical protein VGM03_11940 [Phycisphaerae bacterium]|jgi:hypothetical protein
MINVPPIPGILLVMASVSAAVVMGILFTRSSATRVPACGRCGYPVFGLTGPTCPECGVDLLRAGILTSEYARRLRRSWRAVLWTLLLPIPALVISTASGRLVQIHTNVSKLQLNSPKSEAYSSIEITETARGRRKTQRLKQIQVSIMLGTRLFGVIPFGSGKPIGDLQIDPKGRSYRYTDPAGQIVERSTPIDAAALGDWMQTMGVRTDRALLQPEAEEVISLLRQDIASGIARTQLGGYTAFGGASGSWGGRFSRVETPIWFIATAAAFWLLIWLLGLRRILHFRPDRRR